MSIEITYYHRNIDPDSKVQAVFGIKIPKWDMYIDKIKLIRSGAGKLFIAPPSYREDETDENGKPIYKPYWRFGPETHTRFMTALMPLVEKHIEVYFDGVDEAPSALPAADEEEVPF